jgi:aspartyl/asparaginyl-tRNA synthetase
MKAKAAVELAFIQVFTKLGFTKVSPPTLVQGEVESSATLFKLPYYHAHTVVAAVP